MNIKRDAVTKGKSEKTTLTKYNIGLCILRIYCCYEVICCHYLKSNDSFILAFGRSYAVPIFMLLSFVLSADKINSADKLFLRLKRLCIPFWGWGLLYWIAYIGLSHFGLATRPTVSQLLWQEIFGAPVNPPLWFMSNQILLTVFVYFIIKICKSKKSKNIVASCMIFVSLFLQYTGIASDLINSIKIENGLIATTIGRFIPMITYAMLGILVVNNNLLSILEKNKKVLVGICVCLIGTILYACNTEYTISGFGYEGIVSIILSLCIVLLCYFVPADKLPLRVRKVIVEMSKYILGIYCMHIMVGASFLNVFEKLHIETNSIVLCCLIYLVGYLISKLIVIATASKLEILVK